MVEIDRIVSGKRGWVIRGLMEYVGKGDAFGPLRLRTSEQTMRSSIEKLANLYNIEASY